MSSPGSVGSESPVYPPFYSKTSFIQLGYSAWANLAMVCTGLAVGFSAVAVPKLQSEKIMTLTISETSWITSVLPLAAPVGNLLAGFITDRFGRRMALIVEQLPSTVGWFYIGLARSPIDVIIGRAINSIGAGMGSNSPRTYVTEITLPNMRAVAGGLSNLAISSGVTIMAQLASSFNFKTICILCGCYTAILGIFNCFLPESPYYVLMKGDLDKTKKTLKKFRSKKYDIDEEMPGLIKYKESSDLRSLPMKERIKGLFEPKACKPFCVISLFFLFGQLSGISITTFWTVLILEESMLSVDPYTGNLVLAIGRMVAGIILLFVLYKVGKRPIAITSSIGSGGSYIVLGIFLSKVTTPTIYPLLLYSSFLIFASIGFLALPYLMAYELYPLQVRGLLGGITTASGSIIMFGMIKAFPYLRKEISLYIILLAFGINSMIAAVFLFFFLPETKNKTLHELEETYSSKESIFMHRRRRS